MARVGVLALMLLLASAPAMAQELLDRVLARVDGTAVTLTDVRAAIGLGLVEIPDGADPLAAGVAGLVDRQLVLAEVERFPPPEPATDEVAATAAAMRAGAPDLDALMAETGVDEAGIRQAARDSVRIARYLDERFGTNLPVSEVAVEAYYLAHPDEFTRNGALVPFAEAEDAARAGASAERREGLIDDWIAGLRTRAAITLQLEP